MSKHTRYAPQLIALIVFVAATAHAQEARQAEQQQELRPVRSKTWPDRDRVWPKHWYSDWEWWAGEAVLVGERFGDTYTTANRCNGCVESNPLLGKNPSNARLIATSVAGTGVLTAMHVLSWKACPDVNRRSRVWRFACNAWAPGISSAISIPTILHNAHLNNAASPSSPQSMLLRNRLTGGALSGTLISGDVRGSNRGLFSPSGLGGCVPIPTICSSGRLDYSQKPDLSKVQLVHRLQ